MIISARDSWNLYALKSLEERNNYTFACAKNTFDLSIGPFNGVDNKTSLVYELCTGLVGTCLYADGVVTRVRIGTFALWVELLQGSIDVQVEKDRCWGQVSASGVLRGGLRRGTHQGLAVTRRRREDHSFISGRLGRQRPVSDDLCERIGGRC